MKKIVKKPTNPWLNKFVKDNNLKTRYSEPTEVQRIENANNIIVEEWFTKFSIDDEKNYNPLLIANIDEMHLAGGKKLKVVVLKEAKRAVRPEEIEPCEHISIVLTIFASGHFLVPYFIFPLVNLPPSLNQLVHFNHMQIGGQPSGWIDKECFHALIEKFIIEINNKRKEFKLENIKSFLYVDGHNSREYSETLKLLAQNNIKCETFPSHTSHVIQPIDLVIASPFKQKITTKL